AGTAGGCGSRRRGDDCPQRRHVRRHGRSWPRCERHAAGHCGEACRPRRRPHSRRGRHPRQSGRCARGTQRDGRRHRHRAAAGSRPCGWMACWRCADLHGDIGAGAGCGQWADDRARHHRPSDVGLRRVAHRPGPALGVRPGGDLRAAGTRPAL
ncbi:MAG: hypothetical protein AVDCRST_MAG29-2514, partial [uncultured Nocardioidaceae bacterium]